MAENEQILASGGAHVIIRPATNADAIELARKLREEDASEIWASTGEEPLTCIMRGLSMPEAKAWTCYMHGELACMFGMVPMAEPMGDGTNRARLRADLGVAWMLGTDVIKRRPVLTWKLSLLVVPYLLSLCPQLVNHMDDRHEAAKRWGRRLGFTFSEPAPTGPWGMPFRMFSITPDGFARAELERMKRRGASRQMVRAARHKARKRGLDV